MELAHNHRELSPEGAHQLAEVMDKLLADVQMYHQNIRTLSWDTKLRPFMNLSASLGQLDQMIHGGEEILANQIMALGKRPSNQPAAYLMKTRIDPIESVDSYDHAILTLVEGSQELLKTIREVFDKAVDLEEENTMELMGKIAEQVRWNMAFFTQMRMAQWN